MSFLITLRIALCGVGWLVTLLVVETEDPGPHTTALHCQGTANPLTPSPSPALGRGEPNFLGKGTTQPAAFVGQTSS